MYCVDASALVAIVMGEPERPVFLDAIRGSTRSITPVMSVFETAMAFSTRTGSCAASALEIKSFLKEVNVEIVPIGPDALIEMAIARDRFGKGTGHPAALNFGDCITYAVAKLAGMPILYKGNDFAQTDMA